MIGPGANVPPMWPPSLPREERACRLPLWASLSSPRPSASWRRGGTGKPWSSSNPPKKASRRPSASPSWASPRGEGDLRAYRALALEEALRRFQGDAKGEARLHLARAVALERLGRPQALAHAALTALGALSPLEASLALAFRLLAEPPFALYGGPLADRWPRGGPLHLAALGQGGLTLALLPLLSAPSPLPLYLLGFLFAFLEALRMVAAEALLADLLPKEALARARGQLGALYTAADALSDLAAGLLFTRSRPWTVGLGSGLLFLAAGLYRALPLPPRSSVRPEGGEPLGLALPLGKPLPPSSPAPGGPA